MSEWSGYGRNRQSVGQLWLGFLHFYAGDWDDKWVSDLSVLVIWPFWSFAGATSSRSASLSRWRSSKRCGILRALPSRIRLSSVTTWGLASAGKVRTKCFNLLPIVNENLFLSQWTCTSRRHLSMDGGCLELRWPQIPEGTEQFRWKDPEEKWQTEVELNNFRIIFSTRTCWLMEPLPTIGVAELAERSAS